MPADFGSILTPRDVETRIIAHLQSWFLDMLAAVERDQGIEAGKLPKPRGWDRSDVFEKFDETQIPNVLVVCPGMTGPPIADGEGKYRASFEVVIGAIVSGRDQVATRDLAGWYATALTLAMTRPGIEGVRGLPEWGGLEFDVIPFEDSRTLGAARVPWVVEFENVLELYTGPITPSDTPYELPTDDPAVTSAEVTVTREGGDTP